MKIFLSFFSCLAGFWLFVVASGWAQSEQPPCNLINTAPIVIDTAGAWCLAHDIVVDDPGATVISIQADGVKLDLGYRCIRGSGDSATRAVGIYIPHGRRDITISNGCVDGFMFGIHADTGGGEPSSHIVIEHVRLADNRFRGIMLFAKHATVRRTNITNTGGTTVFEDAYAMGIEMHGDYCRVYENFLSDIYPSGAGEGVGISLSGSEADNCIVESNSVLNNRQSDSGQTIGLWSANRAMVRSNTFVNHTYSIAGSYRDRQNTVRNIAVGENCHGLLYSMANAGTDTLYLPIPFSHCPDVMDAALAKLDWSDRHSLFRMGRLLRLLGKPEEAIIYFRAAALLGSTEAQRQVDRLKQQFGRK